MRIIHFPAIVDPTGTLTAVENLPFEIRRVFWLYDLPGGAGRGGHAHYKLEEILIALSGSFDVQTLDAHGAHRWHLNRANEGLLIPPATWRQLCNFSTNAVALVLASTLYDKADYINSYEEFRASLPTLAECYFDRRARATTLEELQRTT